MSAIASEPPRNAPCPCGSGKRYKDCHGAIPPPPLTAGAVAPLLAKARRALAQGDAGQAEAAWREALATDPDEAEALFHLGNLERERSHHELAVGHYRRALLRAPGHAGVLNNLGLTYEAQGATAEAEACYREVLAATPNHPDALANLANIQFGRAEHRAAAESYTRALAGRRDFPASFWTQRAIALHAIGAFADAEQSFREAARLAPDDLRTHLLIGALCLLQDKFAEVEAAYSRALDLDPGNPLAMTMVLHSRMKRCWWDGFDRRVAELRNAIEHGPPRSLCNASPFPLLAMPFSPAVLLQAATVKATEFAHDIGPRPDFATAQPHPLRLGFVSADFRDHPTSHLAIECWERLDRSRFELHAYSLVPEDPRPFGQRVRRAFDHFVDMSEATDAAIAQKIRDDRIAILFDVNGYTTHSRTRIFTLRPAPIQVNWLGYQATMGARWYDYILVDRFGAPEAMQPFYTERLWHMPHASYPSDTTRAPRGQPPSRAECGLPERGFVFCCFNNAYKILPDVFAIWMRLLGAIPDSVLWLLATNADAVGNLRREAGAPASIRHGWYFAPHVRCERHLARHAVADLFVDTFPYGAHTTTNDALLAGLPVRHLRRRNAGQPHRRQPVACDRSAGAGDGEPGRVRSARLAPGPRAGNPGRLARQARRQPPHPPAVRHGPLYARLRSPALAHLG